MVKKMELPNIKLHEKLVKRLQSTSGSGCLYGLPSNPETKESYLVWTATSKAENNEKAEDKRDLEVLTEILPCGIDPIGIFVSAEVSEAEMMRLVDQLPETFLEVTDPIVIQKMSGDEQFKALILTEGNFEEASLEVVSAAAFEKEIQVVRVRGRLSVVSLQNESDLQTGFKHLMEKVSCPYGTFRLENSDVFFLHLWEKKNKSRTGWTDTTPNAFGDDEEQCYVTNIDEEATELRDLWRFIKDEEDEDDGFGVGIIEKKKKIEEKETLNFQLLMKMSGEACSSRTLNCAPIIHYEKREEKNLTIPIKIDALGVVRKNMKIPDLMEILKGCVQRQIHEVGRSLLSELHLKNHCSLPEVFHFKPESMGHFCSIIYNKKGTCGSFSEFRKHLHRMFLIPVDRPTFRRMNAYRFAEELIKLKGPLQNVHEGLKSGSVGGEVSLAYGTYSYYHYMQDNFDDDKWGCAYRSLQTLISWFRHQGYSATPVPSHAHIQKCLVDIGDKPANFVGSKMWIGSNEVGFVLERACGVEYKILNVSNSEELATRGRDLAHHFKTNGTPIMIGGGEYAYTILGVEWNESTGDIKWLILDPHFTGADWTSSGKPNVAYMQQKGWVGWKGPDFWTKGVFFNMCMPQRPVHV